MIMSRSVLQGSGSCKSSSKKGGSPVAIGLETRTTPSIRGVKTSRTHLITYLESKRRASARKRSLLCFSTVDDSLRGPF
jgi:hypothetical protein